MKGTLLTGVSPEVTFSENKWIDFEIISNVKKPDQFRNQRKANCELYGGILQNSMNQSTAEIKSVSDIDKVSDPEKADNSGI